MTISHETLLCGSKVSWIETCRQRLKLRFTEGEPPRNVLMQG